MRVSITDGLNALFAAPALEQFSAQYPKIQLHLKSPLNIMNLRENQTDMMIGFSPAESSDILFRKLGQLHFIPVVAKDYIRKHGLPTRDNLEQHVFLQSEYYLAKTGLWDGWQQTVARGRIAHYCDNSFAYGMLVKAGQGIGLLRSYVLVEPCFVPLEFDLRISVPLYLIALTDRLNARPVRLVFDWLSEVFGPNNPWFSDEFRLNNPPSVYDAGFRKMFNLEGNVRQTVLADALRDLQVRLAGVVEQLGQVQTDGRVLVEQQLLEHRLVDRDHLLQIGSGKVHGVARIFAVMACGISGASLCDRLVLRWRIPEALGPEHDGWVCADRDRVLRRREFLDEFDIRLLVAVEVDRLLAFDFLNPKVILHSRAYFGCAWAMTLSYPLRAMWLNTKYTNVFRTCVLR